MKKTLIHIAGIFCLTVIFTPAVLQPWKDPAEEWFIKFVEKRQLAAWPAITGPRDLLRAETFSDINQALQDRLPFRGILIIVKNRLAFYLLQERLFGEVVIGPSKWYFIRDAYFRPREEAKTRRVLKMMEYYLSRRQGAKPRVTIFCPPDKDMIYPEKLGALNRALARRTNRRRQIHNFLADCEPLGVLGLTRVYQAARAREQEPIFLTLDTHHTYKGRMLMLKTMVEALQPGLWRDAEVEALFLDDVYGDLPLLSGIGPKAEKDMWMQVIRRGVQIQKYEWLQSGRGWRAPIHYLFRSDTREFIPGKTLVLLDSMLGHYRDYLAQYFSDAVLVHYDHWMFDMLFEGRLSDFDRLIIEVADRQLVLSMGWVFGRLNSRIVCALPPADFKYEDGSQALQPETLATGWKCAFNSHDPRIYLPRTALPLDQEYILRIALDASVATVSQLFYQEAPGQDFREERSVFKDVHAGINFLDFPLSAKQLSYPLRFDPLCRPGVITLQSAEVRAVDPPLDLGPASILAGETAVPDASRLWILAESGSDRRLAGGLDAALTGNQEIQMRSLARGLWVGASGSDPGLELPPVAAAPDSKPVLELKLESSEDTWAQIFYRLEPGQAYSEKRSLRRRIRPGLNCLRFPLQAKSLGWGLRLDPGCQSGNYLIQELAISNLRGKQRKPSQADAPDRLRLVYPVTTYYDLSGKTLSRIQASAAAQAQCTEQGMELAVSGTDPQLLLPPVNAPGARAGVLRLELESGQTTNAQVFFTTQPNEGYSEAKSFSRDIQPGRNEVYFNLAPGALSGRLRLDPACHPGTYLIRSLKLGLVGEEGRAIPLDWSREYCANLSAADLKEIFTYQCSESLSHWNTVGKPPGTEASRNRMALPVPPGLSGKYLLRLQTAGAAAGACRLYSSKDPSHGYKEEHFLCPSGRRGVDENYVYLEGTQLQHALLLDLEPGAENIVRLELRELLEKPGSLEPATVTGY